MGVKTVHYPSREATIHITLHPAPSCHHAASWKSSVIGTGESVLSIDAGQSLSRESAIDTFIGLRALNRLRNGVPGVPSYSNVRVLQGLWRGYTR